MAQGDSASGDAKPVWIAIYTRKSNDENLVIISDPDLAAQYIAEFDRRWKEAKIPTAFTCN